MGLESTKRQPEIEEHRFTRSYGNICNPYVRLLHQKSIKSVTQHKGLHYTLDKGGTVDIADRVLVQNVGMRCRNKLANRLTGGKMMYM